MAHDDAAAGNRSNGEHRSTEARHGKARLIVPKEIADGGANLREIVNGLAEAIEAIADDMGHLNVGQHLTNGHAAVLRRMAGAIEPIARARQTAALFPRWNVYASADDGNRLLEVQSSDGSAAVPGGGLEPVIARMLASAHVALPATGKVSLAELDAVLTASRMEPHGKIAIKRSLQLAGRLVA